MMIVGNEIDYDYPNTIDKPTTKPGVLVNAIALYYYEEMAFEIISSQCLIEETMIHHSDTTTTWHLVKRF